MNNFLVLLTLVVTVFFAFGCATNGDQIKINDSATHQVLSYASGKGMAIGINELYPDVDAELTAAWEDMMEKNKGQEMVAPEDMVYFFNDCISIIGVETDDPYGLIGDLGALLLIFGAEFSEGGQMLNVEPIPMSVLTFFGMGYANGRRVALKEE
jgi:hypothetical protein